MKGNNKSIRTAQDKCPHCGHFIDATGPATEEASIPAPGDFSVCFYCAEICILDDDMKLVKATESDMMKTDPRDRADVYRAQRLCRTFRSFKKSLQ